MAVVPVQDTALGDLLSPEDIEEIENEEAGFNYSRNGAIPQEGLPYSQEQYDALMAADKVRVFVQDPTDPDAEALWVGYQGMGFNITCGVEVDLPEPLAMLLEDSQRAMRIAHKKSRMLIRTMDVRRHLEQAHPERRRPGK
jgi:hypothetical protein